MYSYDFFLVKNRFLIQIIYIFNKKIELMVPGPIGELYEVMRYTDGEVSNKGFGFRSYQETKFA